jgi:hypothetical protein
VPDIRHSLVCGLSGPGQAAFASRAHEHFECDLATERASLLENAMKVTAPIELYFIAIGA